MNEIKKSLNVAFNLEQIGDQKKAYTQYLKCNELITSELLHNSTLTSEISEKLLNLSLECINRAKLLLNVRKEIPVSLSPGITSNIPIFERFSREEDDQISKIHKKLSGSYDDFKESFGFLSKYEDLMKRVFSLFKTHEVDEFKYIMSIMMKGDVHEQINLSYKLFDIHKKGFIFKRDFFAVMTSILDILRDLHLDPSPLWIDKVDKILKTGDPHVVTKNEFFHFFKNHSVEWKSVGSFKFSTKVGPAEGLPICLGHPSFQKVLQMMLGIRYSLMVLKDLDYEIHFRELDFMDYYPNQFRQVRKVFGVSDADYMSSFSIEQFLSHLFMGKWSTLSERMTDGKSGNFFYWTANGLFLCKTISNDELETFKTILPEYVKYVQENPKTLICRYYGLHLFQGTAFVVMGNVFNQYMMEIYDIKGSTLGRTNPTGKGILKDLDFDTNKRLLVIQEDVYRQIEHDIGFLAKFKIIDYSLLIGFCHNGEIQYGIIDVLIEYGYKKMAEHQIKSWMHGDETSISVTRPDLYASRLLKWIQTHLGIMQNF